MELDVRTKGSLSSRGSSKRSLENKTSQRQKSFKKQRTYEIKVGNWDPGLLAKKIMAQHDIKQLIEDKVVDSNPVNHFERLQLKLKGDKLTTDVTEAYLEKNPVQIDGLGFGSTSYA